MNTGIKAAPARDHARQRPHAGLRAALSASCNQELLDVTR